MACPRIRAAVACLRLSAEASEIVAGIAMGETLQQVAERLGVERAIVLRSLQQIFRKTGIKSPAELVSVVLANVISGVDSFGPPGTGDLAIDSKAAVGAELPVAQSR